MINNNSALQQLAEYIYAFCGIDYLKDLPLLQSKISDRLKELNLNVWEYCGYIKVEKDERDKLIELITINETYFFREENLLNELRTTIFPKYKDRFSYNPLRIWCAACSSGEEPYTLAMIIKEMDLFREGAVEIIASDINMKVLNRAQNGKYNKRSLSFRKMPEEMIKKYFDELDNEYKVKDEIRKLVKFKYINMLDKNIRDEVGEIDIILCRNVLIYFDLESIKKVANTFYDMMKPKGHLLLGHAETITNINPGFETIYTPSIFYYLKGEE